MAAKLTFGLRLARELLTDQLPRLLTDKHLAGPAQALEAAGHVDRVAPQVESELARTDDAADYGSGVNADADGQLLPVYRTRGGLLDHVQPEAHDPHSLIRWVPVKTADRHVAVT